ncbi:hypothetical protein ASPFODRAFT_515216 [Aspergillus luchuensis CBS 106.47]|uniref:Uncharacterized protein n=1 Tax=Aspergillus luchuensis (strain CBS 106.47) TaxID=1137211 RepID=A0A1M3TTX5_ASPLC|nr:hypothetical protein ASPFODRAFT_515216 [Aspergillus luchuensis CBS 106.47]
MQGRIDLGKSDEATAQSGSVDELAGELIGCRCARSATSLQLPYSLSRLVPLQPCSLTCWLSIYRIMIASPHRHGFLPLGQGVPWSPYCFFVVSCFVFQQGRFATLGSCLSRTPAIIPPDQLHPNKLVPDDRMLCLAVGLHKWR